MILLGAGNILYERDAVKDVGRNDLKHLLMVIAYFLGPSSTSISQKIPKDFQKGKPREMGSCMET